MVRSPGNKRIVSNGFTIVELVVVIVLISILSVTALARLQSADAFVPRALLEDVRAQVRYGSRLRQHVSENVLLSLVRQGDQWRVAVVHDGAVVRENLHTARGSEVVLSNGALVEALVDGDALELAFTGRGDIESAVLSGTVLDPELGLMINVNGAQASAQGCVYPTGYVSRGNVCS